MVATLLAGCGADKTYGGGFASPEECLEGTIFVEEGDISAPELASRCEASRAEAEDALAAADKDHAGDEESAEPAVRDEASEDVTEDSPDLGQDSGSDAVMPDIPCGMDLQAAQDRIQETGVFFSRSEDASGEGRSQVLDRNWTVIRAEPAPGTPIGEGDVVFYVVKDEEFAGC